MYRYIISVMCNNRTFRVSASTLNMGLDVITHVLNFDVKSYVMRSTGEFSDPYHSDRAELLAATSSLRMGLIIQ